jgi:hypothetical protein
VRPSVQSSAPKKDKKKKISAPSDTKKGRLTGDTRNYSGRKKSSKTTRFQRGRKRVTKAQELI